jgi:hypothetical protein
MHSENRDKYAIGFDKYRLHREMRVLPHSRTMLCIRVGKMRRTYLEKGR